MTFRAIRRLAILSSAFALGILVGCTPPPAPDTPKPVELTAVSVAELDAEIRSHQGKVVLIDVWFLGCAPCVKKMPQFVELHRELQGAGLVCMTLDTYTEELKKKDKVLDFLKEKGADTINLMLNDRVQNQDDWIEKYDCARTPAYVAFNRKGEFVRPPEPADKENMTRFLKKLLAEK